MDPLEVDNEKVQEMKSAVTEKINSRFPGVTIHDFRMVQGANHTRLVFDAMVPFDFELTNEEVKKGIEILVESNFDNCFAIVEVEQSYV